MAREVYIVDYHLICTIYFSTDVLSGSDLAVLWRNLRLFGDLPVEISSVFQGDRSIPESKNTMLDADLPEAIVHSNSTRMLSASASSVRPDARNAILDSDLNFVFRQNGTSNGIPMPAFFQLSFSGQIVEQVGGTKVTGLLRRLFEIADCHKPLGGLVDLARPGDAYAGLVYGTAWPRTAPLARFVEHLKWTYSGPFRTERIRNIYWGNYLSELQLDRLGGRDKFAELFSRNARDKIGSVNAEIWQFPNGCFFSLCLDPVGCRPNNPVGLHPAAEANLKWLIPELARRGILSF